MPNESPVPQNDPLMVAWNAYKRTDEYANAKRWAMFAAGFSAATGRAADLHEQIDPASDMERLDQLPGAGAMGAVIEYRDKIRQTVVA